MQRVQKRYWEWLCNLEGSLASYVLPITKPQLGPKAKLPAQVLRSMSAKPAFLSHFWPTRFLWTGGRGGSGGSTATTSTRLNLETRIRSLMFSIAKPRYFCGTLRVRWIVFGDLPGSRSAGKTGGKVRSCNAFPSP